MTQPQAATTEAGDPYCPSCGYNLRGLASDRCPECGIAVDWQALERSVIPWNYRKQMGAWRGFWRTVFLVSRHPLAIARDISRPVSYRDAQKFRWLVVLVAWLPMCAGVLIIRAAVGDIAGPAVRVNLWTNFPPSRAFDFFVAGWVGAFSWPIPAISILLFLACVSGSASYFFHPRGLTVIQQNRAIALSLYSCAPLALIFVPTLATSTAALMIPTGLTENPLGFQISNLLFIVGFAGLPCVLAICWVRALFLLKYATHSSTARTMFAAVMLPAIWAGLTVLTLLGVPIIYGMLKLMIYSYLR